MSRYKKLGKNIGLVTIGSASSKLLNFFLLPLYTSVLSTAEYGTSDLIFTLVGLLLPFFTLVIYEPLMRFSLDNKDASHSYLSSSLFVFGIGTALLLFLSPLVLLSKALAPYYIFVVLYYLMHASYTMFSYYARGQEKVAAYSIGGVINTFSIICFNLLFLLVFKLGIVGYLLSYIIGQLVATMYLIVATKAFNSISLKQILRHQHANEMIRYSLPMMPNSISWWISNYSDKYVMLLYHSTSLMGIYSVSYKIPSLISVFSSIFSTAWQISAVEDFGSNDSRRMYSSIYSIYTTFLMICVSGLMVFTKFGAFLLFKKEFYTAWKYVPFLLIGTSFHSLAGFLGTVYTSAKSTKTLFTSTLVGALSNIVLNFILIPNYGAYGAAFATMVSYLIVFAYRIIDSRKFIVFDIDWKKDIACWIIIIIEVCSVLLIQNNLYFLFALICFASIILIRKKTFIELIKKIVNHRNHKTVKGE